jgi:hypothetical protein
LRIVDRHTPDEILRLILVEAIGAVLDVRDATGDDLRL